MPKVRDKRYWRSYRRVKNNVSKHISSVNNNQDESLSLTQSVDLDSCGLSDQVTRHQSDARSNLSEEDAVGIFQHSQETLVTDTDSCSENDLPFGDSSSELDMSEVDSDIEDYDLNHQLATWASTYNITQSALRELLKILNPVYDCLPKDPRTLMQTQKNIQVIDVEGGLYHHFGIEKGVRHQLSQNAVEKLRSQQDTIQIQLNIDGIPLFKSSGTQFWPILGRIVSLFSDEPFIIGIFVGNKKPSNIQLFLQEFVLEMKRLEQESIYVTLVGINFT